MGKLMKLLVVLAFAGGLLYAGSYAGARVATGKFLGTPKPDMGARTVHLAWDGISGIPSHPRGWEITYSRAVVNANRPAKIYVSLDGKILATVPKDLDARVEAWHRANDIN